MIEFDFIIVGGGSAGCVLANRLSADPSHRVLLIEAGGSDRSPLIHVPAGNLVMLSRGLHCWKYLTVPQRHLGNRELYDPRGKVLGGTSSINGLIYDRGSPLDYERWSAWGNAGWSYREVLPYFMRSEAFEPGRDDYHGTDGPLAVSRSAMTHPLAQAFCAAGVEAGFEANPDINGARRGGFGPTQMTASRGRRSSTAVAFLRPVRARTNLTIVTHAQVTRIRFEGNRARSVDYLVAGQPRSATASREIALAAGVYNSPQLLLLSGVGDPRQLAIHGIATVAELKGVGRNLQDHLAFSVQVLASRPITLYGYFNNPLQGLRAGYDYLFHRRGPLAVPPVEAVAVVNSEHAGREDPDIKFHLVMAMYTGNGNRIVDRHGFMLRGAVHRPESKGSVTLRSADPLDLPLVDPNICAAQDDRRRCRSGIRLAREIIAQRAFDEVRGQELYPGIEARSDAELDAYIAATTPVDMHAVGTCRMGLDELAVVDAQLRVRGLEGLRVVDASVMPQIVGGNTNAATIMIAEKAADMLLGRAPLPRATVPEPTGSDHFHAQ